MLSLPRVVGASWAVSGTGARIAANAVREDGTMPSAQDRAQQAIDALVGDGRETGVQVAAYLHGELVVDATAGLADPVTGRPVDGRTLFNSWSTGKAGDLGGGAGVHVVRLKVRR
jgi:CubicO group peptidase (beta-lactamase class C family)